MQFAIFGKYYFAGKSKLTGLYVIKEQKKAGYIDIWKGPDKQDFINQIKHLKELGSKRCMRQDVADICGTSYAAAKRDMGL